MVDVNGKVLQKILKIKFAEFIPLMANASESAPIQPSSHTTYHPYARRSTSITAAERQRAVINISSSKDLSVRICSQVDQSWNSSGSCCSFMEKST
jgi:hypothetical protein